MPTPSPTRVVSDLPDHRLLHVYQTARELALQLYAVANALPPIERFDLACQIKRAAVSVGWDIAEDAAGPLAATCAAFRTSHLDLRELEFQLDRIESAGLAASDVVIPALETMRRVQQMLTRLIVQIRIASRKASDG